MKKITAIFVLLLLSACAAPQASVPPKPTATQLVIPTRMPFPTRISTLSPQVTPTNSPTDPLADARFLTEFSNAKADWDIVPGYVTAAQINAAVAQVEGEQMHRDQQKVLNGFLRVAMMKEDRQVLEVVVPAEIVDGKLKELKVKSVRQTPVLASRAILLEDYFAINFPDLVDKWEAQGAQYEDFKYAAVVTVTWATKYGPLRVSYLMSGKYISQEGKYPGRLDFMKLCLYEQTKEHYLPNGKLTTNWFPAPIVGLSGTYMGVSGAMKSDAFGWTPMTDFAHTQSGILTAIGQAVHGVAIESRETLARLQTAFDRAFMPVHCAEVVVE